MQTNILVSIWNFIVTISPFLTFFSFLALVFSWFLSPRFKLWVLERIPRLDKPTIGQQCAVFMKPRIEELRKENPEVMLPIIKLSFTKKPFDSVKLDPDDNVITIGQIGLNNLMGVLLLLPPYAEEGSVDLTITTVNGGGQEVTFIKEDAFQINLFPIILDENENKP